jgi:hypothetical protein
MSWLLVKHWTLKTWVGTKTYWCAGVWLMANYFLYKFFLYKKEEDETFAQTVEKKLKVGNEEIKVLEQRHHKELQKLCPVPRQDESTHWLISRDKQAPELKE